MFVSDPRSVCLPIIAMLLLTAAVVADDLPAELSVFRADAGNPVFASASGQWDTLIRERGWIMRDRDLYRMWYTGYDTNSKPLTMKLGYATSQDGVHWKRHTDNPIHDDVWVEDMMVVRRGDTFFMFAEGANDQSQLLKSTDGLAWTRVGTLDVRLVNGEKIPPGPYGTPTAWFEDGTWYLFYERRDQGVWLATSKDMHIWTNVSDDPVLKPGPARYDELMIAMNQIVKHKGRYYAVMHGTGTPTKPRDWCTYFAVSNDLRTWKKCDHGPVLPIRENKSSGVLVPDGLGFRLYTMHAKVDLHFGSGVNR